MWYGLGSIITRKFMLKNLNLLWPSTAMCWPKHLIYMVNISLFDFHIDILVKSKVYNVTGVNETAKGVCFRHFSLRVSMRNYAIWSCYYFDCDTCAVQWWCFYWNSKVKTHMTFHKMLHLLLYLEKSCYSIDICTTIFSTNHKSENHEEK